MNGRVLAEMRAIRCALFVVLIAIAGTPAIALAQAQAQTQDCTQIVRDMFEQKRLGELARMRAEGLRASRYHAEALYRGLINGEPRYTLENLTRGISETRSDPYFGSETARGIMLSIHLRTLEALGDILAGNALADNFGLEQNRQGTTWSFLDRLTSDAQQADTEAGRYEWAANSLGQSMVYCLTNLPTAPADPGFTVSSGPTAGTAQSVIPDAPPAGMTTLCQISDGPRRGQTVNMSREYGFPLYVPIGDICYDPQNDTSIGLAVAQ